MLSFFLFINRCFLSFEDKLFAYLSITPAFIPEGIRFKNSMTLRLLMSAVRSKRTLSSVNCSLLAMSGLFSNILLKESNMYRGNLRSLTD